MQKDKVIATYGMGLNGIEILSIEYGIENFVIWRWVDETRTHRSMIKADELTCDSYFKACQIKVYLSECMRMI